MKLSSKEYYTGLALTITYYIGLLGLSLGFLELLFGADKFYTYLTATLFATLFVVGKLTTMAFIKYSLKLVNLKTIYTQVLLVVGLTGVFFEFYSVFITPSYEAFYYTLLIYCVLVDKIISYQYSEGQLHIFNG